MFWGVVIRPGNQYKRTVESAFHVSKACSRGLQGGYHLVLRHQNKEFLLCFLQSNSTGATEVCQQDLNLNFSIGEEIEFFLLKDGQKSICTEEVDSKAEVSLTGYYLEKSSSSDNEIISVKKPLVNGHALENGDVNEIISIKKRPIEDTNGAAADDVGSKRKKVRTSAEESTGDVTTVGEIMHNLSRVPDEDTDDDEDFNASGLDEEGQMGSDDDEDESGEGEGGEDEDGDDDDNEEIEEDELAGLQEDMNMSLTDLKRRAVEPEQGKEGSSDKQAGCSSSSAIVGGSKKPKSKRGQGEGSSSK